MQTALILYTQGDETPLLVDLYENENISLNWSFNDIQDLAPRGNYSRTFRIPFTPTNASIFGFIQENTFQFSGFNPKRKINASITVDTIPIIEGYVQFKAAYTSNGEVSDLEIVFFGNTVNFFKTIGDADFKNYIASELQTDYPIEVTFNSIDVVAAYDDIQFGLTDRGNNWNGNSIATNARSIYINPFDNVFDAVQKAIKAYELTPFVRARYIFDKIFALSGFEFNEADSTTLTEQLDKMWIPFTSENNSMTMVGGANETAVFKVDSGIDNIAFDGSDFAPITLADGNTIYSYTIPAMTVVNDPGGNVSGSNIYTVPFTGNYIINGSLNVAENISNTVLIEFSVGFLRTDPNGNKFITASRDSNDFIFGIGGLGINNTNGRVNLGDTETSELLLESGTTIEMVLWGDSSMQNIPVGALTLNDTSVETTEPYNFTSQIECVSAVKTVGNIIDWAANAPVMKCSEFMSSLFKMFNLVVIPDDINPKILTFKPIQEYLAQGVSKDWSNKLDVSKDITLTSTADYQAQKNSWSYKQSNDYLNNIYNSQGDRVYGRLELLDPENDFATNDFKVESLFFPTPCALINNTTFAIPKFINDAGGYVSPGARILYKTSDEFKIDMWDNDDTSFTSRFFPLFNHYTSNNPTITDEDLNFGQEVPLHYVENTPYKTLYQRYWNDYIADIYAPDARVIEAFFALDFADIYQFKFNDKIFIKDAYYRILEINDYVVGMQDSVKVKLLKVVSATPDCLLTVAPVMNVDGSVRFLDENGDVATATQECCDLYGYFWVIDNCFAKIPDGKPKSLQGGNKIELLNKVPIVVSPNTGLISTPNNNINNNVLNTIVYGERNEVTFGIKNSLIGGTYGKAINSGVTIGSGGTYAGEYQSGIIQVRGAGDWTNNTTPITLTNERGSYITVPDDSVWYAKLMLTIGQISAGIDGNGVIEFNIQLTSSAGVLSVKDAIIVSENLETISGNFELGVDIVGLTFAPQLLLKNSTYPENNIFIGGQIIYNQYHYE
jgi:hypothetical protein